MWPCAPVTDVGQRALHKGNDACGVHALMSNQFYYSKDPRVGQSLRRSVRDGVAYAVMTGTGESYFSAYALFLKATTAQIAVLAAFPPLIGSLAQLLSAWLARRIGRRKPIIVTGALLQAFTWFPIIWLPYFFPEHAVTLLIACIALYYGATNLSTPLWSSLMGDLVPARKRGRYFGRRTRLASISSLISLIGAGIVLNYFDAGQETRLGFCIIFSTATIARFYSAYQLNRMHDPPCAPRPALVPDPSQLFTRLRNSQFVRYSLFVSLTTFSVNIAAPFFSVHMLRDLKFTYAEFMANTTTSMLVQFLTLGAWGWLIDVIGNRRVLAIASCFVPALPALWLLSDNFWYLLGVQVISGLGWAGFSLSAANFLYDVVPSEKRATYAAFHNVLNSSGIFFGALLGGSLAAMTPEKFIIFGQAIEWTNKFWAVFIVSACARAAVPLVFLPLLHETRAVRHLSTQTLVQRFLRRILPLRLYRILATRKPARPAARPAPAVTAPPVQQQPAPL